MAGNDDWRSPQQRALAVQRLQDAVSSCPAGLPQPLQNPVDTEKSIYEKSRSGEEYNAHLRNIILILARYWNRSKAPVPPPPAAMSARPVDMLRPTTSYQQTSYQGMVPGQVPQYPGMYSAVNQNPGLLPPSPFTMMHPQQAYVQPSQESTVTTAMGSSPMSSMGATASSMAGQTQKQVPPRCRPQYSAMNQNQPQYPPGVPNPFTMMSPQQAYARPRVVGSTASNMAGQTQMTGIALGGLGYGVPQIRQQPISGLPAGSSHDPDISRVMSNQAIVRDSLPYKYGPPIWSGHIEIIEVRVMQRQVRNVPCQILCKSDVIQDIKPQHWPPKMTMNTYPKNIFTSITQLMKFPQYGAPIKSVAFNFLEPVQSIPMLRLLMSSSDFKHFAIVQLLGTNVNPQCTIKAMILVWNDRQQQFAALIPLEQNKFVQVIRQVFAEHRRVQQERLLQQEQIQQDYISQDEIQHQNTMDPLFTGYREEDASKMESEADERIRKEALEEGVVKCKTMNVAVTGHAGVGKTCTLRFILNMPPPDKRDSTGVIDGPFRAVSISHQAQAKGCKLVSVSDSDILSILFEARLKKGNESCGETQVDLQVDEESLNEDTASEDLPSEFLVKIPYVNGHVAVAKESESIDELKTNNSSSSDPSTAATPLCLDADIKKMIDDLTQNVKDHLGSEKEVNLLFFLDSGGQPEYHEMLSTLVHHLQACIVVVDLSESLNSYPIAKLYKDGKHIGSCRSRYSHQEIIARCIQTMQSSQKDLQSEGPPQSSKDDLYIFVVGTHFDAENSAEALKEANAQLRTILQGVNEDRLICYRSDKEIIFPINSLMRDEKNDSVVEAIRGRLCHSLTCIEESEIPIRWFALRQILSKLAKKADLKAITIEDCQFVAQELNIPDNAFKPALEYLRKHNLFLYYPDELGSLPRMVFCEPQALLDPINDLVQAVYNALGSDDSCIHPEGKAVRFEALSSKQYKELRNLGIITETLLCQKDLQSRFDKLFTPAEFLRIAAILGIAAKISSEQYMFPCLLPPLDDVKVKPYRCDPSSEVPPFLVNFKGVLPESGVFSTLIASLIDKHAWKPQTDDCAYRNCIQFKLPDELGLVTVINSLRYFEVHTSGIDKDRLCHIRRTILKAIPVKTPEAEIGFFCIMCKAVEVELHLATLSSDNCKVHCRVTHDVVKHYPGYMNWIKDLQQDQRNLFDSLSMLQCMTQGVSHCQIPASMSTAPHLTSVEYYAEGFTAITGPPVSDRGKGRRRQQPHVAIERVSESLKECICALSTPSFFASKLVQHNFMSQQVMDEKLSVLGVDTMAKVNSLVSAVVARIKHGGSLEVCFERFNSFVHIIIMEMQFRDMGCQLIEKCSELCPGYRYFPPGAVPREPHLDSLAQSGLTQQGPSLVSMEVSQPQLPFVFTGPRTADQQAVVWPVHPDVAPTGRAKSISILGETPLEKHIVSFKYKDKQGQIKTYRIRDTFSSKWKDLGAFFEIHQAKLQAFATKRRDDPEKCFKEVISHWINQGCKAFPNTWNGLLKALDDVGDYHAEVRRLKAALEAMINDDAEACVDVTKEAAKTSSELCPGYRYLPPGAVPRETHLAQSGLTQQGPSLVSQPQLPSYQELLQFYIMSHQSQITSQPIPQVNSLTQQTSIASQPANSVAEQTSNAISIAQQTIAQQTFTVHHASQQILQVSSVAQQTSKQQ